MTYIPEPGSSWSASTWPSSASRSAAPGDTRETGGAHAGEERKRAEIVGVHARAISARAASRLGRAALLVYPAAMRAIDVRLPLYGEDLERGDLRD